MDDIRDSANLYWGVQKLRIQLGNRIAAVERGDSEVSPETLAQWQGWHTRFAELEEDIGKGMEAEVESHPAWPWLQEVKGIGPILSAKMLGQIGDIATFDTVSKLWRFAGLAVIDGKAERRAKGEKSHYNGRLKTVMYLVAGGFLKARGQYSRFYYEARQRYELERLDWTKGHRHLAALRVMEKVFLSHLWGVWRSELGLDTRPPWIIQHGGHDGVVLPQDVVPGYDYQHSLWEGK